MIGKILLSILLLLPVAVVKVLLVILGLVLVPVTPASTGLYRAGSGRPNTYWERAIRNPVGGFGWLLRHPNSWKVFGSVSEPTPDGPRFQWRFRIAGILCSLRLVWRYSREKYGEMYLGWKIDSAPPEFDFALSLRPRATIGN